MKPALLAGVCLLTLSGMANAATIDLGCNNNCIKIDGELKDNDGDKFVEFIVKNKISQGVVYLNSPGGEETAGLVIGYTIKKVGLATYVSGDSMCASMCGAMWLAGSARFVQPGARIGFHTTYMTDKRGRDHRSADGNRYLSQYYRNIGLNPKAIKYLEQAGPDDMSWLQPDKAQELGIAYTEWNSKTQEGTTTTSTNSGTTTTKLVARDALKTYDECKAQATSLWMAMGKDHKEEYVDFLKNYCVKFIG
jgi:hypothetical protein